MVESRVRVSTKLLNSMNKKQNDDMSVHVLVFIQNSGNSVQEYVDCQVHSTANLTLHLCGVNHGANKHTYEWVQICTSLLGDKTLYLTIKKKSEEHRKSSNLELWH